MTRHLLMRAISLCAVVAWMGVAIAADEPAGQKTQPGAYPAGQEGAYRAGQPMKRGVDLERASHLIGMEVKNQQHNTIGSVKDIVLTEQRDAVAYVALAHGGILGAGEKILPIAWNEFHLMTSPAGTERGRELGRTQLSDLFSFKYQERHLMLNVNPDQLDQIQGVGDRNWPDRPVPLAQLIQARQIAQQEVSEAREQQFETRRLSKLIGMEVRPDKQLTLTSAPMGRGAAQPVDTTARTTETRTLDTIGELKDVVFNTNNGRLIYGVVSLDKIENYEEEASIVPWSALQFQATEPRFARLSVPDTDTLLAFRISEIQNRMLANQGFARGIYGAYDRQPQWEVLGFVGPEPTEQMHQDMQQQREHLKEQFQERYQERMQHEQEKNY
jgi:sporulation protein YlmC with PRC-barrel domain